MDCSRPRSPARNSRAHRARRRSRPVRRSTDTSQGKGRPPQELTSLCPRRGRSAPGSAIASRRGRVPIPGSSRNTGGLVGIIGTILVGLIVGFFAKLLMPGKDPGGVIVTILLGIVGSVVGRWL